jgi:lipopolysaccharide assembly outer membrane protein LptD (OstA)
MKRLFRLFYICYLLPLTALAQKPLNPPAPVSQSIVEIIWADIQEGVNLKDMVSQTFTGNVVFKHQGVIMGTDKAIQNTTANTVQAFGNIKINQGDTLTIVGDTLFYEGNTRVATIWGKNVILRDKKVTLRTKKVIYDMATGMVHYPVRGQMQQDSSILSSNTGYYNTRTKYFNYIGDVEVMNPKFVLCTDTMDYDTHSKRAIFKAFTTIKGETGNLSAEEGWYNIQTKESYFSGRSEVDHEKYLLIGDTLQYDNANDFGWARGNVVFVSKTDSVLTVGDEAIRVGKEGITKVNGATITRYFSQDALIASDTLRIIEKPKSMGDSTAREVKREDVQWVIATGRVNVFREDMQSLSDSLVYNAVDSTIGYYKNPVLWQRRNQIKADSIQVFMKDQRISRMELLKNCFIIEQDSLLNFNQIKGRNMEATFDDSSRIEQIHIMGNAESKYFILDEKNKIVGLDLSQCSSMKFFFLKEVLEDIHFYGDVDSRLVPPNEITASESRFEDFQYRIEEKPSKEKILNLKHGKLLESSGKKYFPDSGTEALADPSVTTTRIQ